MLRLEVLDNGEGGHNDIIFSIEGLIDEEVFDTYWLIIGGDCETFQDVKNAVAKLLMSWENEILAYNDESKPIYLPLDISDQYIGCIRVLRSASSLQLTYGFTQERDLLNSLNTISDFSDTENKSISVEQVEFLTIIKSHISQLQNFS